MVDDRLGGPRRPTTSVEVEQAIDLVVRQQQRAERTVCYLGDDRDGILAELEALEPPWRDTLRVLVEDGLVVGTVAVEWDEGMGRAWVMGPWVDADGTAWDDGADRLLGAAREQLPDGVRDVELGAFVAHAGLERLAGRAGLERSAVSHVLVVTEDVAAAWSDPAEDGRLRAVTGDDLEPLRRLHDAAFPATHTTADVLVTEAVDGTRPVLVAEQDGRVVGYAAGQVQPGGKGYVDYVAVADGVRRGGTGRALLVRLVRDVLAASSTGRVSLTVEEHRAPARRLYEALGFVTEASIVGYRTPPADR